MKFLGNKRFTQEKMTLSSLKDLRLSDTELAIIEQYFLNKDLLSNEDQKSRKQELMLKCSQFQIGDDVWVQRQTMSEMWGVKLGYSYTRDYGLVLVLTSVSEPSPAWQCGLRQGDLIVQINDWRIASMDKPEVAVHLFQASAHRVKFGVMREKLRHSDNYIGVF